MDTALNLDITPDLEYLLHFGIPHVVWLRRRSGKTQQQIADMLGVTVASVVRWELGKVRPTTKHYMAYMKILRIYSQDAAAEAIREMHLRLEVRMLVAKGCRGERFDEKSNGRPAK